MAEFRLELVDTRKKPFEVKSFVFPKPNNQDIITLAQALSLMHIDDFCSEQLFANKGSIGVFGVVLQKDSPVYDGDRIEMYTPILIDPKNARRKKANQTKDAKLKAKAKQRSMEKALRES